MACRSNNCLSDVGSVNSEYIFMFGIDSTLRKLIDVTINDYEKKKSNMV